MIPKELLKKIRRIEIRTSQIVNDVLSGQYHSAFKGRGMEFEEVRQYQIGDDIRTIDWNVSARYGEPYVKVFREERELTVILMVDMSASNEFGTNLQLKRDLIAEISGTLAFSAIKNNDKVGLICFTNQIEKVVPARKGARHVLRVIRELLYHEPYHKGTNLNTAFEHLNKAIKRRAVVFLISDFQDSGYEDAMRVAKRKHDLIPIIINDQCEQQLPDVGIIELYDNETGRTLAVDTSNNKLRTLFANQTIEVANRRNDIFRRMDVDSIPVKTGESFVEPLTRFFRAREARL